MIKVNSSVCVTVPMGLKATKIYEIGYYTDNLSLSAITSNYSYIILPFNYGVKYPLQLVPLEVTAN
jgi:hypothetical protein